MKVCSKINASVHILTLSVNLFPINECSGFIRMCSRYNTSVKGLNAGVNFNGEHHYVFDNCFIWALILMFNFEHRNLQCSAHSSETVVPSAKCLCKDTMKHH